MSYFALCFVALAPPLLLFLRPEGALYWLDGSLGWSTSLSSYAALLWPLVILFLNRRHFPRRAWRALRDGAARTGLVLVILLHCVALFAPLLETHPPAALGDSITERFQAPSSEHWMGTDLLGRDLFSRVIEGSRVSLTIGVLTVAVHLLLGVFVGGVAGYAGGRLDGLLMRFTDLLLAFPRIFLLLAIVALFQPSSWMIILVLGATGWMGVARVMRGEVLRIRGMEWIEAARALGIPRWRILLRHILPMAASILVAQAALRIGNVILTESFLSFLGLGVTDPDVSWGMLIRGGRAAMLGAWWVSTFPGLAILLTVVAYNLLGDGLRDAYDPKLAAEGGGA
ncbi:MAG TPA: ABC transporter permease [Candidatus Krumholzibacteria bacterium]|jgi:peptide/nickel transport system permease protein